MSSTDVRLLIFLLLIGSGCVQRNSGQSHTNRWQKIKRASCHCRGTCDEMLFNCSPPYACKPGWMGPNCEHVDKARHSPTLSEFLVDDDAKSCGAPKSEETLESEASYSLTYMLAFTCDPIPKESSLSLEISATTEDKPQGGNGTVPYRIVPVKERAFVIRITKPSVRYNKVQIKGLPDCLCSLHISGGGNVAFHGDTLASVEVGLHNLGELIGGGSNLAVDGNYADSCFVTPSTKVTKGWPWIAINFNKPMEINKIVLYNDMEEQMRECTFLGMEIYFIGDDNKVLGKMSTGDVAKTQYVIENTGKREPTYEIKINTTRREACNGDQALIICEMEIIGDTVYAYDQANESKAHATFYGCTKCSSTDCNSLLGCYEGCTQGYKGHYCDLAMASFYDASRAASSSLSLWLLLVLLYITSLWV